MASITLIGPVTGFTNAAPGAYRPTLQHDPVNAVMKITVDMAKLAAAFKASNSNTALASGDKVAIAPLFRGLSLLTGKILNHRKDSGAVSGKANGRTFALGDTATAAKFLALASLKTDASVVGTPVALIGIPVSYDAADDALVMTFTSDAANDIPVDGAFEIVLPFTNMLPELKASLVNGNIV